MADNFLLHDSYTATLTTQSDGKQAREFSVHWVLDNFFSYSAAEARALALAPESFSGHKRQRLELKPIGNGYWDAVATYATPDATPPADGGDANSEPVANSLSLDTTGGTEHITQAFYDGEGGWGGETKYPVNDAPDFYGAINVSGDSVQGVDITVPAFNWTEVWTWPSRVITDDYAGQLYTLTGSTNSNNWRIFKRGEVLFLGARYNFNRNDPAISVTYQFSARPNQEGFNVGEVAVTAKRGWQYMWIKYEDAEETAHLIKRPKFVYINDVYPEKDFSVLGLGLQFPDLRPPPSPDDGAGFFARPQDRPVDWNQGT